MIHRRILVNQRLVLPKGHARLAILKSHISSSLEWRPIGVFDIVVAVDRTNTGDDEKEILARNTRNGRQGKISLYCSDLPNKNAAVAGAQLI